METIALAFQHGPPGDFDGGPGLFFFPFMLLFWVLILGALAWAAFRVLPRWREGGGGWPGGGRRDPAEEILRERFARGETNAEEFTRALRILREDGPGNGPADYEDYVREEELTDPRTDPNREPGA